PMRSILSWADRLNRQCPAVSTHSGAITVPPHMCSTRSGNCRRSVAKDGQADMEVRQPPITFARAVQFSAPMLEPGKNSKNKRAIDARIFKSLLAKQLAPPSRKRPLLQLA